MLTLKCHYSIRQREQLGRRREEKVRWRLLQCSRGQMYSWVRALIECVSAVEAVIQYALSWPTCSDHQHLLHWHFWYIFYFIAHTERSSLFIPCQNTQWGETMMRFCFYVWENTHVPVLVCVSVLVCVGPGVFVFVSVSAALKQQSWQAHHQPLVAHQGQLDIVRQP